MTRTRTSSPASAPRPRSRTRPGPVDDPIPDHDKRWRPRDRKGPVCAYTFRDKTCPKRGAHYCEARADRAVAFPAELLRHIKGPYRRRPFVLRGWQEHEVVRPLFGEVLWSVEWQRYVRRYRRAFIIVGRKNGKSEIAAAIQLILMIGDDEEAAEVYQAAKDTKQAEKVFGPALRMVQLSPVLARRLRYYKNERRLVDEKSGSIYEVITADAKGELGHNPHGFNLDEVLSQPDGSLWEAMDTADGAREQELLFATSTETDEPNSFGASLIDEAEKVQEDPRRAPHVFTFIRKAPATEQELARLHRIFKGHPHLPVSTDIYDERNWKWSNPALDQFKSREALRRHALAAKANAAKEKAFRQFQLNQRVQQAYRFIPLDLWDLNAGELAPNPTWRDGQLAGRRCWAGLDLSSKLDLTAWALLFDDGSIRWRFWVPEAVVPALSEHTDGAFQRWCDQEWITVTDGNVIDYQSIYEAIEEDHEQFAIVDVTYDKWSGEPVRQEITERTGLECYESGTTYDRMTGPMTEFSRALTAREYRHGGNPVARWMAEHLKGKSPADDPDRVRPVKPDRKTQHVRIDGLPALFFAIDGQMRGDDGESVYDYRGLATVGGAAG
ncbi:terminase large subunit [Micromonospora craterilacus]|uniref:terminase large subunit n=1 Tax=Micromonospora craterilacus TaxID=1655439 RepID=UPI0013141744|nr:terminase TerL endonuclease subunit [Micromonospora craterilacus]